MTLRTISARPEISSEYWPLHGSAQYNINTKLRSYQNHVFSILLYSSEYWGMTNCDQNKPQSTWGSSKELCGSPTPPQSPVNNSPSASQITWRPSSWEGRGYGLDMTCEESKQMFTSFTIHWTPEGRSKNTWCWGIELSPSTHLEHHSWVGPWRDRSEGPLLLSHNGT